MVTTEKPPYSFDVAAYQGCYEYPPAAMDRRHVFMLHEVLRSWPFENTLELGCFFGASSTAFIEAINRGSQFTATFCDVSLADSLYDVVNNCVDEKRVRVTPMPSWMVLDSLEPWDFILVDAAHDLDSVTLELKRLLRRKPLCIMAHDTNGTAAGVSKCEGAEFLKKTFEEHPDYYCIEDAAKREGEHTDRGLFLATTDPSLYRIAQEIFRALA